MTEIRMSYPIDPALNHDCDRLYIQDYQLKEVVLPATRKQGVRRAIAITLRGRNFKAVAQPLFAFVGQTPVSYLQIAPDERSVEGILLNEPESGSYVEVFLGEEDAARHPIPFEPARVERIEPIN
jgi:hypothetical protein